MGSCEENNCGIIGADFMPGIGRVQWNYTGTI